MTRIAKSGAHVPEQASSGAGRGDTGSDPRRDRARSWHAGLASLSIPAVAREAGVSVPTVYRHFATKQHLIEAIYPHVDAAGRLNQPPPPRSISELQDGVRDVPRAPGFARRSGACGHGQRGRGRGATGQHAESGGDVSRGWPIRSSPSSRTQIATGSRVLLVVLTQSSSLRMWHDHLGLSVDEVADEIDWLVKAAIAAAHREEWTMTRRSGSTARATCAWPMSPRSAARQPASASCWRRASACPDGVVIAADAADMTSDERRWLSGAGAWDLGAGPFAVRSSGIAEDGVERSFAGMYESVLNVSADDVPAAVDRCLASASAARVAEYEAAGDGRMAVIVQRMVAAAAAGVALTADPINGDRSTCVVTAVRGLGERLVSGEALGDEWVVGERWRHSSPSARARHRSPPGRRRSPPRRVASRLPAGRRRTSSGRSTATARCGSSRPGR